MDILIIQKGERIGPLSETQVRQFLDDGLVSPNDLASYDGMEDWLPVELVLSHLPPFTPTPEITSTSAPNSTSASPTEATMKQDESPFLLPNPSTQSLESMPNASASGAMPSLTASQKTKRKLNKIVIQPILPLETTLPQQRKAKTGKTAVNLEPLRSTISLPPVTGHQPKEKKPAGKSTRTGKLELRATPEPSVTTPLPPPPLPPLDEVTNKVLPEEEHVAPVPSVTPEIPVISPEPDRSTAPKSHKRTDAAPHFSVLPKGSAFMPPTMRSVGPPPRRQSSSFPYAAVALAIFIISVFVICLYILIASSFTAAAHSAFVPPPSPSIQTSSPASPAEPTTVADFSQRGLNRQAKGDVDGAIADFTQALTLDPKAVEVLYQRGQAREVTGDMAGAIADYTEVIALDPKRANAFSNRGFIKQAQGDVDGALADYNQALLLDPKIAAAHYNMGLIKVQRGDLDGAIADYDQALQIDPKMAFAYYNRGVAKNSEGDADGAVADYTQALALNPNIARAYCDRGAARQAKGDVDGALADYTHAVTLNPKMGDAFYNRGLIEAQKGDLDAAIADNTQVIALDPKYAQAYNRRGLALYGKGKIDDALADLKQFCVVDPRDTGTDIARLYIWLISTKQNAGNDADAALSTAFLNEWNSPPEDLTSKIASFLLGHITESDLIANAASPDLNREPGQYCRVWYFAGMKRLLGGDATTAASYFQKSLATGQKDICEYTFSQAELQSLNKSTEIAAKPDPAT